ncbi:MAG: TolC family protein, partial [Proteobacteria bacterium]
MSDSRHVRIAVVIAVAATLSACAVGPNYKQPKTTVGERFDAQPLLAGAAEGEVEREWWKLFGDPLLDELVDTAVKNNRDVAAATARLRQARSQRRERLFDFLPTITGNARYDNVRQSAAGTPGVPSGFPLARDYELFDVGFDASWEFDLFGRVRRLNESARAAAQAANAARNQVALSVIAEVARNYFELRGAFAAW